MPTDARLDPVRWRGPRRVTVLRVVAVAALLAVAGLYAWAGTLPADSSSVSPTPSAASAFGPTTQVGAGGRPNTPSEAQPDGGRPSAASGGGRAESPPNPVPGDGSAGGRPDVPPGHVGVPVRLADPTALALVRPGDRVTLLRLDDGRSTKVADDVLILAVTGADDLLSGGLMVALKPAVAVRAASSGDPGYAVLLRPD
jgi:hypothetical protein